MRMTGYVFETSLSGYDTKIPEATVSPKQIMFDIYIGEVPVHAVLQSKDGGLTYKGTFGAQRAEKDNVMEATRFNAKNGDVLLWVNWCRKRDGDEGALIALLERED